MGAHHVHHAKYQGVFINLQKDNLYHLGQIVHQGPVYTEQQNEARTHVQARRIAVQAEQS